MSPAGGLRRRAAGVWESPRGRRVLLGLLGVAVLAGIVWFIVIPWPFFLGSCEPVPTALMDQRVTEARRAGEELEIRQEWVPLEAMSQNLRRAVLVAEDDAFYEHQGIDWRALADEVEWEGGETFSWWNGEDRAALRTALGYVWENRSAIRGRSTITQQLAKNLYFGTDRSFVRKGMEFLVAQRLERSLEKDRILEIYLNVAEWGPGIFGAEAASRAYFDRAAADLTRSQAAALAATLPHPLTSNPARNPGRMRWRQNLILQRMDPGAGARLPPIPPPILDSVVVPEGESQGGAPGGGEGAGGVPVGPDTLPVPDPLLPDTVGPSAAPPDTLPPGPGVAPPITPPQPVRPPPDTLSAPTR